MRRGLRFGRQMRWRCCRKSLTDTESQKCGVTADLSAKSVRRAIVAVREQAPEAAAIMHDKLEGNAITDAGLSIQPRQTKKPIEGPDALSA
jgi:hypothetical protein